MRIDLTTHQIYPHQPVILGEWARRYGAQGQPVFPCRERNAGEFKAKAPYTTSGFKDATTDQGQIERWWTKWPGALIGRPVPDGLICLDFDYYHGGDRWSLIEAAGLDHLHDATPMVLSGRQDGSHHLFFAHPGGPLSDVRLPDGIDLRAGGKSYTIVPPSPHPDTGEPYLWRYGRIPPVPVPAPVLALLRPPERPKGREFAADTPLNQKSFAGLLRTVADTPPGNRDRVIFWAACRLFEKGAPPEAFDYLRRAADHTGFPPKDTEKKIESARRTIGGSYVKAA